MCLAGRRRQRRDPDHHVAPDRLLREPEDRRPGQGLGGGDEVERPVRVSSDLDLGRGARRIGRDVHACDRARPPCVEKQADAGLPEAVIALGLPECRGFPVDGERGEIVVLMPVALGVPRADGGELDPRRSRIPGRRRRPGRGRPGRVRVLVVDLVESLSLRLVVTITNNTTKNATSAPAASKRLMYLFMFAEDATKPAESRGYTGQRLRRPGRRSSAGRALHS